MSLLGPATAMAAESALEQYKFDAPGVSNERIKQPSPDNPPIVGGVTGVTGEGDDSVSSAAAIGDSIPFWVVALIAASIPLAFAASGFRPIRRRLK